MLILPNAGLKNILRSGKFGDALRQFRMLNINNALCNKRKTQRAFFIFTLLD